ncbi:GIY-YIG nuclease family protein [Candidatus Daviesbacteria bacterium]|nr:GIY-YIG nuclease family protein [Candidatus Daviesbacteria bacterium]
MSYFVYILTNKSNTLYTGVTNNLERRMWEHKNKLIPGFTSLYNLNKLIYFEEFGRIEDAISAEKKIKGWTRKKKIALIKTINPKFKDLSK